MVTTSSSGSVPWKTYRSSELSNLFYISKAVSNNPMYYVRIICMPYQLVGSMLRENSDFTARKYVQKETAIDK